MLAGGGGTSGEAHQKLQGHPRRLPALPCRAERKTRCLCFRNVLAPIIMNTGSKSLCRDVSTGGEHLDYRRDQTWIKCSVRGWPISHRCLLLSGSQTERRR